MTDPALIPADVVRTVPEGEVVYGMQLPIQSQSTLYVADWEKEAGPTELARIARVADEAGFFYLGVCDHTAIPRRLADAMGTIWYDTTATLGWLAAVTTQHPPAVPRADPGPAPPAAGGQGALDDRPPVGRPPHRRGGRRPRPRGVRAADGRLRRARPPHRRGRVRAGPRLHRRVPRAARAALPRPDMGIAPRPVRQPRPPIWIGGSSPAAIRRTAAFGDGWLPQGTRRRDLPGQIARLRELRDELRGGAPIDIGTIVEPIYLTSVGSGWDLPGWVLSGGADEVASSLRELVDMGVNHLQVRFMARSAEEFCEQTARFGVEVGALLNH